MKLGASFYSLAVVLTALFVSDSAYAIGGRLPPRDFNKMYYLATKGKVGILREAVNRGLNIDAVNPNGDTGLCIAIKRKDYIAYNTFRMSGANPRHACTYRISKQYREFLQEKETPNAEKIVGNEESLYYNEEERSWWPWILGGAAVVGGGILAFSGDGGSDYVPQDDTIAPAQPNVGLASLISNSKQNISSGGLENSLSRQIINPNASQVVNQIKFLPNVLSNSDYLLSYAAVSNGAYFNNLRDGIIKLYDGTVAMNVFGDGSKGLNNGNIQIDATNGSIGMAASNGGQIINAPENAGGSVPDIDDKYGNIDISFKGNSEDHAVIGMYGDTGAKVVNYGNIKGSTTASSGQNEDTSSDEGSIIEGEEGDDEETVLQNNSGTILGMALFDLYTGMNLSSTTVSAENYGNIELSAGYNSATDVAVSLIGMGSYIDDKFLDGNNNPALAEQMKLNNYGNIHLFYQGSYNLADTALKLGKGGLIGIRADASTEALNRGKIHIDLTSTTISQGTDVAAGMLSVHGAQLTNGDENNIYDGSGEANGTILITNEATSGGVVYGMLAAKGDGSQTRVYDWKDPKLANYGLIDMQVSNGYAMASFAGGDVINYGVINLGVENGQSRYNNNYGLYAAGEDKSGEVLLQNKGIINVYSEESTAIYNAFSGAVDMVNDGTIYISNKATNSKVFGGNFSSAYNKGSILYKVGNSDSFTKPSGDRDTVGQNVNASVVASAIVVSGDSSSTKQLFVNDGDMTIGAEFDKNVDYGGTYGTAGVQVSKQGSAVNNGTISLESYDPDFSQFNVGMWLDSTSTAEAYINNYGDIRVGATNSIGIRNDSTSGAAATNFGNIYVSGLYGYGMAVTNESGSIFNGRINSPSDSTNAIYVTGGNSTAMYIKNGTGYNYGSIYLQSNGATAFQLDGETAKLAVVGDIYHNAKYDDITYFWVSNGANYTLDYKEGFEVEDFTLGKATDGGTMSLSAGSTVYAKGTNSYLMVAQDAGSTVYNYGNVYATAGATPIIAADGATAENSGKIYVQNGNGNAMTAHGSGATIQNNIEGNIFVDGGNTLQTMGDIQVNSGVGLYANQFASANNYGNIEVTSGVGMYVSDQTMDQQTSGQNAGKITVSGNHNVGVFAANGASFNNSGTISVSCSDGSCSETGDYAYGIYAYGNASNVTNTGTIIVGENSIGMYQGENSNLITLTSDTSYGMKNGTNSGTIKGDVGIGGVNVDNKGDINIGTGTGIYGQGSNSNSIIVNNGNGALVTDGGYFSNSGSIQVGDGNGVYVMNGSGENTGSITLTGSGFGVKIDKGSFNNKGTITFNSDAGGSCTNSSIGGTCVDTAKDTASTQNNLIYIGENASFVNSGVVDMSGNDLDFNDMKENETGSYVVADGGSYKADSIKGDVIAGSDIVMGGFDDTYINENSFVGKNEGINISSGSYMFEASTTTKDDVTDVELNRKEFEEIMDDKELANFFETNYGLQNNEKLFDAIKGAGNKQEFDYATEVESGKNFYANLPRENMAVLRGLNEQEQNRILEDGLNGSYFGMDFYRTGKDAQGGLSGYADNVYSPYIGFGEKINYNWRIGGTLRAAYADAEYDEASSSRDNKILMAFLPILYQNGDFQFLTMPSVGAGYGTYKRHALSGTYEADTLDFYYGLYNHAEYSVDMKVAELVAEAELNLQGSSMSEAEEDDGLNLDSNSSVSMEAGVGLKIRKRIQLAKNRSLMLALGTKYYHEFLDPYKDLRVRMDGSPVDFGIQAYEEDKNRLKTTAEAIYKDGDIAIAAQVSHNAEKESSIEGGVGVRYNF